MTKGYRGESCADAIRDLIRPGERKTYTELFEAVKKKGAWKDETVNQHQMGLVVNLLPARHHWKSADPFLPLHKDGTYELYDRGIHPEPRS